MFLECREGMSFIEENNEGVSNLLKKLTSSKFQDVCKYLFTLDDGVKSHIETLLLKWLEEISQDPTRLGALTQVV